MRSKSWRIFSVGLLVAAAAGGWGLVAGHQQNAKLRAQAAALRERNAPVVRLATENQHTRDLVARAERDTAVASGVLHQEVVRLRAEIEALEDRAREAAAKKAAAAEAIAANRDPMGALMRLENFENVGRATPAAAIQTLIWAAMKGDDPSVIASLSLMADAREEAQQLWAHLPESSRAKYPAPENLAALVVTGEILRADALQISATTPVDASHAIVAVRLAGVDGEEKVPVELTFDGWKVQVPKKMILGLEKKLKPSPSPVAPAKS